MIETSGWEQGDLMIKACNNNEAYNKSALQNEIWAILLMSEGEILWHIKLDGDASFLSHTYSNCLYEWQIYNIHSNLPGWRSNDIERYIEKCIEMYWWGDKLYKYNIQEDGSPIHLRENRMIRTHVYNNLSEYHEEDWEEDPHALPHGDLLYWTAKQLIHKLNLTTTFSQDLKSFQRTLTQEYLDSLPEIIDVFDSNIYKWKFRPIQKR